jgi:hypothetical protein
VSNEMSLFGGKGNPLASSDLFKSLMDLNKTLAGSGGGGPRISIKGGRFREIVGGEQVRVFKGDQLNVVVVNAAPISRTYFGEAYDPNNAVAPTCWSSDTKMPNADVPKESRQSATCATCPMNIKGSGQGDSRACRFNQRLAVTVEGDETNTVYQMQLPATSIFGDGRGGKNGMQAYAKLLAAHNTPAIAIVTGVMFDEDSETPKLHFKPVRPLDEEELQAAMVARDSAEAKDAITMTVSQTDGVAPAGGKKAAAAPAEDDADEVPPPPKKKAKPAPVEDDADEAPPPPKKKAKPAPVEDDADEAPTKRATKAEAPAPKADLASIIGQWDDDDDE